VEKRKRYGGLYACDDLSPESIAADYALFADDLLLDMHMCLLAVSKVKSKRGDISAVP
jgi:hypothetical protein